MTQDRGKIGTVGIPEPAARADPDTGLGLPNAVSALCEPQTVKVLREERSTVDGSPVIETRTVTVRAVLAELRESVTPSGQGGGGGRGTGLPLSLEALDVLDRVVGTAADWLHLAGLTARAAPHGVDPVHDAMRRLAAHGWSDPAQPAQLARILARLTGQARALLSGDAEQGYARDTRCPRCQAWDVVETVDGWEQPHPPLLPVARAGRYAGVRCTACWAWWPWDDVDDAGGPLRAELDADTDAQRADLAAWGYTARERQLAGRAASRRQSERQRAAAVAAVRRLRDRARRWGLAVPG